MWVLSDGESSLNIQRIMKRLQIYLILVLSLIFLGTLPSVADSKAESWNYPSSNPGLSSFDGSGTASSPYLIKSAQDLANLAYIVTDDNDDVTGKYFKMTRDIYLNDFTVDAKGNITVNGDIASGDDLKKLKQWTPIGEYGKVWDDDFQGIFDGDGHTIYGLYIKELATREYVGLFGSVEDAVIKNLTIKNAYVHAEGPKSKNGLQFGTLVGCCQRSTVTNVHVVNCYMLGGEPRCNTVCQGGLMGVGSEDTTIDNCSFDGTIYVPHYICTLNVGGLLGSFCMADWHNYVTLRLTHCQTKGDITVVNKSGATIAIGGFVGGKFTNPSHYAYITECVNRANLTIYDESKESDGEYPPYSVAAHNFTYSAKELKRSVNFGDITITSKISKEPDLSLIYFCEKYLDCANYGHYTLPTTINNLQATIKPGQNHVCQGDGQNLIVWQEAKPANLGDNDTYESSGTELGVESLNENRDLVAQLNEDVGENVWGLYALTENDRTYYVPCPIACGATPIGLYKNYISSEADLRILQTLVNSDATTGVTYILTHDIDMSASAPLKQIGDEDHPFKGTFDGSGHVISGLTINGHALFGGLSGTVKKLGLVNMKFTGDNDYCAPFAYKAGGSADASILDCYAGGNITLADSTNTGTILAGLLYEASANKVSVKNCYFRGIMANATNVSNQGHFYYGLVGSNRIGTALTLSDCYAHFDVNEDWGVGAGLMPTNDAPTPDSTNCHYLCPQFNDSIGRVLTNAELAACFADKEGWLAGAYRPVLNGARHYALTTYDGQTVYADAIPLDDDSCRNEIFCHQLTTETASDPLLWALPKVAACDTESGVNYLLNCQLYADKPFRFTPPEGSETKGQMRYPLTFSDENDYAIRLMCLPATLHKSNLPDSTEIFLMGKPTGDATEGYEAYIVACDSVPAGVPFLISMNKKPTEAIDVVLRGDVVSTPQTTGTLNGEVLESGLVGTFKDKHLDGGCANFGYSTSGFSIKYEENIDLKPFSAYIDANAAVSCNTGVLLKETSNYIDQMLATYKDRTVNVFLSRKLQTSGWNTLCLPFDVTDTELLSNYGDNTRLEELTSITVDADGTCSLNFTKTSSIEAGKCYLIKPEKAESYPYLFADKTLCTDPIPTTLASSDGSFTVSFMGSFARTAIDGNDTSKGTYFTQNNKIYKVAQGRTIAMNGFRCWIETSKADVLTKALISHADGTTSIADIVCIGTTENGDRIYDIRGIETTHPDNHQVYIKDGRKWVGAALR